MAEVVRSLPSTSDPRVGAVYEDVPYFNHKGHIVRVDIDTDVGLVRQT